MKRLLTALFALVVAAGAAFAAPAFPALTGRVVDDAHLLSAGTDRKLTALLAEHEKQTGNQVVIATIKSLDGNDIRDYGYRLGRAWKIGQKGKDNGVVILVAAAEHDVSIEVGYGLEGDLTDAQSKLIIENTIVPAFKKGDFDGGLYNGSVQVLRTLGGNPSGADAVPQIDEDQQQGGGLPLPVIIFLLIVFGRFFWPLLFLGGGRGGWGGGGFGGFGGGGFGGGGFSGGGGSFGGGGASGRW
jgi:uncharacterized protein